MKFLKAVFTDMIYTFVAMLALLLVSVRAMADAAVAAIPDPTYLNSILAFVGTPPGYISGAVLVLEFVARLFPTEKSLSLLIPVRYFVSGAVKILQFTADSILTPLINSANNSASPIPPLYKE